MNNIDNITLAKEINEFIKDSDPYEYNDTVEDEIKFIMEIYEAIRNNDIEVIKEYLKDFIEEGGDEEDIQKAKELLKELEKGEQNQMKKMNDNKIYGYAVYFKVYDDSKTGYSIFVKADSEKDAIDIIKRKKLYEDQEDLYNIKSIDEITEEDILNEYINEDWFE